MTSDQATELACTLLSNELGCDVDEVQVIEVEVTEWSDSSLGCSEPGMMYMQVITPGYRITLQHAAQRYVIHTDWDIVPCAATSHRQHTFLHVCSSMGTTFYGCTTRAAAS